MEQQYILGNLLKYTEDVINFEKIYIAGSIRESTYIEYNIKFKMRRGDNAFFAFYLELFNNGNNSIIVETYINSDRINYSRFSKKYPKPSEKVSTYFNRIDDNVVILTLRILYIDPSFSFYFCKCLNILNKQILETTSSFMKSSILPEGGASPY